MQKAPTMPERWRHLAAYGGTPSSPRPIPIAQVMLEEADIDAVVQVLRSGQLRAGRICQTFEEAFAAQVGARYAVSVSSGTAALHIAYAATLEPGDEVLVPAFTFFATASMISAVGARPIFCDVHPETFTLDVEDARRRITPRTRAIVPVHLFGNPADVAAVQALAEEHNLVVIWDAAQAHGARYQGQDVGGLDHLVCYSFYPTKHMTTGEGGMITTNDPHLYERCRLLRDHGQHRRYEHVLLGYNYRLTDVMAALGLRQLKRLPAWVRQRRQHARYLIQAFRSLPGLHVQREQPGGESSFNLLTVALDLSRFTHGRDTFVELLRAENIGVGVHYPRPLHWQPVYRKSYGHVRLPVAEALSQRVFSLPVHPALTQEDLAAIVRGVRKVVEALIQG